MADVAKRQSYKKNIMRLANATKGEEFANASKSSVKSVLDTLNKYWEKYLEHHDEVVSQSGKEELPFQENEMIDGERLYLETPTRINKRLETLSNVARLMEFIVDLLRHPKTGYHHAKFANNVAINHVYREQMPCHRSSIIITLVCSVIETRRDRSISSHRNTNEIMTDMCNLQRIPFDSRMSEIPGYVCYYSQ